MQRWSDLTPDEHARYEDREQLLAQLAERTTVTEQLSMALHVRDTQLTAVTAERDDYRSRFRDLEHELQLERGQVVATTQRAEAAEVRAERAEATLTLLDEYAAARLADPYNDKLTFAYWLQSRA